MEKLTVILPVYNGEKHIRRCIESVLQQTYRNIELLIIDDGSTDVSVRWIDEYQEQFAQITVIHQENQGVARARNLGIERAVGEYITFIDQDDYYDAEYCAELMDCICKNHDDVAVGGYKRVDQAGNELYREHLQDSDWSPYIVMAPWAHLYKKEYLLRHKITFLSTGLGEDVYFNMWVYGYTQRIAILQKENYNWVDNPKSVSNSKQASISPEIRPRYLLDQLMHVLPAKKNEYQEYFFLRYIVWYILYTVKNSDWDSIQRNKKELFEWLEQNFPKYQKNPNISWRKPKADNFSKRIAVYVLVKAKKVGLDNILLRIMKKV